MVRVAGAQELASSARTTVAVVAMKKLANNAMRARFQNMPLLLGDVTASIRGLRTPSVGIEQTCVFLGNMPNGGEMAKKRWLDKQDYCQRVVRFFLL